MSHDVSDEELVESVQSTTAGPLPISVGSWQESNGTTFKPAVMYQKDILKKQPHLTSQAIGTYSKFKWEWFRSVNKKRTYKRYSKRIRVRPAGVVVTKANSPFVAPVSRKNDADVIRSVDTLNKEYMFVVEEANPMVLEEINASIKTLCMCQPSVSVKGLAYLMLGNEGTPEDTAKLTSMLQDVNFKRLEWTMIPNPEPSISVPSVAGQLSPKGCASVQLYGALVLRHTVVHDEVPYDYTPQADHQEMHEPRSIPNADSSSGWEGVVSSDASSRRWHGSALMGPNMDRMRGMTSSSDTSDTRISIPSRVPPDMREKMKKMLSPRMYLAVRLLRMPQKSWWVAFYFAVAAGTISMLRFALTDFRGVPDGGADGGLLFFANFGPTLFSYIFIWMNFSKATDVWYNIYSVLSEARRLSISTKWEKRCMIATAYGMVVSLLGCMVQTRHIIVDHSDMVLDVPAFCGVTGMMWLLNIVQTCLVSYGLNGYMFMCRLSKYDIRESKLTLRNFSSFLARCAKMHKLRMMTFVTIFTMVCFEIAVILHTLLRTVHVKYFIFVPFGVILPHLSSSSSNLGGFLWTLLLIAPYMFLFGCNLDASLWAAKAKAVRQTQLTTGELRDKFIESPLIAGWCLFHRLVR